MAGRITCELSLLNPEKKEEYERNFNRFVKEIEQLDNKIRNDLRDYKGGQFILFHPSFSYFAHDYGLIQYSLEPGGK